MAANHGGYAGEAYGAHVWIAKRLAPPEVRRPYVVKNSTIFVSFPRFGGGPITLHGGNGTVYRPLVEANQCAGSDGFGWVGADFFPCRKDIRGVMQGLLEESWHEGLSTPIPDANQSVLAPGAAGPISALRFEMLREGTQETQAVMLIARALYDPAQRARLGEDLAGRAEDLVFDRAVDLLRGDLQLRPAGPWQAESERLYSLAGEVAGRLAGGK